MRLRARYLEATRQLSLSASESPELDASLLISLCLGLGRERLFAMMSEEFPETLEVELESLLKRRASGEPIAYILGKKEFRGLSFKVDSRVLIPRPDTEILVDECIRAIVELAESHAMKSGPIRVHDACTGSGCVAISLTLEVAALYPDIGFEVTASDISGSALELARENALCLGANRIDFYQSDLLLGLKKGYDIIASNPPYVTSRESETLLAQGWGEPRLALDGGLDGMDILKRLIREASPKLVPGGRLLIEAGPEQHARIRSLLELGGFSKLRTALDLAGRERVSVGSIDFAAFADN